MSFSICLAKWPRFSDNGQPLSPQTELLPPFSIFEGLLFPTKVAGGLFAVCRPPPPPRLTASGFPCSAAANFPLVPFVPRKLRGFWLCPWQGPSRQCRFFVERRDTSFFSGGRCAQLTFHKPIQCPAFVHSPPAMGLSRFSGFPKPNSRSLRQQTHFFPFKSG